LFAATGGDESSTVRRGSNFGWTGSSTRTCTRPARPPWCPRLAPSRSRRGGHGTVLLLDSWALLGRPDLRAGEETLRRWLAAAALARPAGDGGTVFVGAAGGLAAVQALLRWAPAWHAARELADRTELGFPPATRLASITGPPVGVANLIAAADLPAGAKLLGPVPLPEDRERLLVRVSRPAGAELARALAAAQAIRSARKAPEPVRVELDPLELF